MPFPYYHYDIAVREYLLPHTWQQAGQHTTEIRTRRELRPRRPWRPERDVDTCPKTTAPPTELTSQYSTQVADDLERNRQGTGTHQR